MPISASPFATKRADAAGRAAGGELGLGRHLRRDAELLDHRDDRCGGQAAAGRVGVADRLGVKQRALQRIRRRDVGLACALPHRDADAGSGEIGAAGLQLALLDQFVDAAVVDEDDVGGLAGVELPHQAAGRAVHLVNGVAVGAANFGASSLNDVPSASVSMTLISAAWAAPAAAESAMASASARIASGSCSIILARDPWPGRSRRSMARRGL